MTPEQIDKHVGAAIRRRRRLLNQSQGDLAKTCGLTFQQIQKYETGKNRVSASKLFQIAESQVVPVSFYFEGIPQAADTMERQTEEVIGIARRLIKFPADARASIIRVIEALEVTHG